MKKISLIVIGSIIVVIVGSFFLPLLLGKKFYRMPGGSMIPTIGINEYVLVDRRAFRASQPQAEDIIVFLFPTTDQKHQHYGNEYVKRVVATAGQKVQIINKELFVDGVLAHELYKQHSDKEVFPGMNSLEHGKFQEQWIKGDHVGDGKSLRDNFGPITVPNGAVFVLGDNREKAYDSRFFGPVPLKNVKGKVVSRGKPFSMKAI